MVKTFHVPTKWMDNEYFAYLVNHSYATEDCTAALQNITETLKKMGYMEDNDSMIHDYLVFSIEDLLDKNGEVFITEQDVRGNASIKKLLAGLTPDLVIKKNAQREKTVLLDVYVGSQQADGIKNKYKKLDFFSTMLVVTPYNFQRQLKEVLPESDIDYLYKNFQVFLTEYSYWRACIKFRKVLLNNVENVPLQEFKLEPAELTEQAAAKVQFLTHLAQYGDMVANQALI
ncbi:hypothetical protein PLESTB_001481000 [Pleodorina starrii]|uniref:Uncharacterized protein n=1 Tax=Pleodorina starrii TaxID=330485 RepID=A0A9W6BVV3_9CHLO|nr:hypothetical protein PLESTB_001481000 [Pleodorina starrii]GLC74412.1 hypothetical protein PLESTF_001510300 [Pleodorina starrii]